MTASILKFCNGKLIFLDFSSSKRGWWVFSLFWVILSRWNYCVLGLSKGIGLTFQGFLSIYSCLMIGTIGSSLTSYFITSTTGTCLMGSSISIIGSSQSFLTSKTASTDVFTAGASSIKFWSLAFDLTSTVNESGIG